MRSLARPASRTIDAHISVFPSIDVSFLTRRDHSSGWLAWHLLPPRAQRRAAETICRAEAE